MRTPLSLPIRSDQIPATRPPEQNIGRTASRPHDTDWKADAHQIAARALVGQVTPIGKAHTRRHYESLLAQLRGETGAGHV